MEICRYFGRFFDVLRKAFELFKLIYQRIYSSLYHVVDDCENTALFGQKSMSLPFSLLLCIYRKHYI